LSSLPERTLISYFAALTMTTDAAPRKESRKDFINVTTPAGFPGERSGGLLFVLIPIEAESLSRNPQTPN
jgi:hypothetical protein